jgi:hypothetical protein
MTNLNVKDPKEYLQGSYDLGLGYCLQCLAEYKVGGEKPEAFPRFAVVYAPMSGVNGLGACCYQHLAVTPPPPRDVPMTPEELAVVTNLVAPNGGPARHRRQ